MANLISNPQTISSSRLSGNLNTYQPDQAVPVPYNRFQPSRPDPNRNRDYLTKSETEKLVGDILPSLLDGVGAVVNIPGNAGTASALASPVRISVTGDANGLSADWLGNTNLELPITLANTGVAEGTYNLGPGTLTPFSVDEKGRVVGIGGPINITIPWSRVTTRPTTLAGYGITNAPTVDGFGAFGTWGINVTGNADTADRLATAVNINGSSFNGTGDIVTSYWGVSRNITIGATTKAVNGSANVSWSFADLGALSSAGGVLTGSLTVPVGTVSVPSINFFGDTDTGVFSPGAGIIGLSVNGLERLRVNSSGDVGIGTASPGVKLDVVGDIKFTGDLNINNSGTLSSPSAGIVELSSDVRLDISSDMKITGQLDIDDGSTYSTTLQTITPTANRVISFPDATGTLALVAGSSGQFIYNNAGAYAGTGELVISGGNIGVGTTTPTSKLHVTGTIAATSSTTSSSFIPSGSTVPSDGLYLPATNALGFSTNSTERVRIDSTGRMMVGAISSRNNFFNSTSAPGSQLQVEGAGVSAMVRNIADNNGAAVIIAKTRSASNTIVNSGDEIGIVSWQGNDGTEFVEAAKIRVVVDGTPGANNMPGRLVFSTTADGASSPIERMRIDSAGNVGIGVSSPGSKLAVNGSITESTDGGTTYHNVVTAQDVGTAPNQIPLNQFLGQMAFVDRVGDISPSSTAPQDNFSINFEYVSDTSIKIRMRGSDGVVRSVTLTLS